MSFLNPRSRAEASDSLATLTAAAVGLAAIVYSVNVFETVVSSATAAMLSTAQVAGAVALGVIYVPLLLFFKSRGARPAGKPSEDSYLSTLFRQAALTAFSLTIVFMFALSILGARFLEQMTAEMAIDVAITFALTVFALSFFVINRFFGSGGDIGQMS